MYSCSAIVLFCFYCLVCRPGYPAIIKPTTAWNARDREFILVSCMPWWALASSTLITVSWIHCYFTPTYLFWTYLAPLLVLAVEVAALHSCLYYICRHLSTREIKMDRDKRKTWHSCELAFLEIFPVAISVSNFPYLVACLDTIFS